MSAYMRLTEELKSSRLQQLKEKIKNFDLEMKKLVESKNCKDLSRVTIAENKNKNNKLTEDMK